jgi:hypothetical protein
MSTYDRIVSGILGPQDNYGGMLDDDVLKGARQKALMATAAQLLQAGGPSSQPTSFGQALGGGILAGQQAQGQAGQDALQAMLIKSQIAKAGQKTRGKLVAVIGKDGTPVYVPEEEAVGQRPFSNSTSAMPAASLQEYQQYVEDEKKSGRSPKPFLDFSKDFAAARAQYPFSVETIGGVPTLTNRTSAATGAGAAPPPGFGEAPQAVPPRTMPLSSLSGEANAKRTLAQAGVTGEIMGTETTKAQLDLPRVQANAEQALKTIEDFKNHPGYGSLWGWGSKVPTVPGTSQAGARTYLAQIKGKTFIEAFNSLKGAGAVTDVEGGKGTEAIARLDTAQSEADGTKALNDLEDVIKSGLERVKSKASGGAAPARRRFNPATGKIE